MSHSSEPPSRSVPPSPPLTPAQLELFESEPDVAAEAVKAAIEEMGEACFGHLMREDLLSIAAVGAMEATTTFDPGRGTKYRTWAFFAALHAVLDSGRVEHASHAKLTAMVRASVMVYFAEVDEEVVVGVDTDATLARKLHGFSNTVLGLALAGVAATAFTTGGEDEVVELETAALAGDALRQVLPDRGTGDRRMIELHFVGLKPLTEVATIMGVEVSGYRSFVRHFHEVVASLRERLIQRGIRELPPWSEAVSGHALLGEE